MADAPNSNQQNVPAPRPIAQTTQKAAAVPATPANIGKPAQAAAAPQTATTQPVQKTGTPLPKDQSKSNRKFVIGCLAAFGCSLFLFLGILFAFLAFGSAANPIFGFLGVPPGEVVNVLITLVNLFFLVLVFVAFVTGVIGIFKLTTAKKDDTAARKKGSMLTFGALGIMVLLIMIWVFAYFFLAQKRTIVPRTAITTIPAITTNLTAPIPIKFDGANAPINRSQFDILSYNWDFSDKSPIVAGVSQTHTFTDVGNFRVKLIVAVKEKSTNDQRNVEFTKDVSVTNVLANVNIKTNKKSGEIPLKIEFDGTGSSSQNGEITAYSWDLNGDGVFGDSVESKAAYTYDKVGTYKVSLRVTDSSGANSFGELEIDAKATNSPVAVISVDGLEGTILKTNIAYIFSGAQSTSPSGKIEKYSWEFSDGGKASTRNATHTFITPGTYDVMLTITDSEKKTSETSMQFVVSAPDAAPLVSIKTTPEFVNGTVEGQAPFNVIFDGSGSKDINDDIVDYAWDFDGDGKVDDTNAVTSHTFADVGTYNTSLTVTDASDLSTKSQVVIKVTPADLKAEISADTIAGSTPLTVQYDASASVYPTGKIVSYEWDFGDGSPKRIDTAKVTYQYTKIGTFTAKVTAIASDSKRASAEVIINVRPVSLRACFEPSSSTGKVPLDVEFDPTCSTGTVIKYSWNFSKLGSSSDRKPKFTFKDPGEYTVTLQVFDNQNVVDTFSKIVIVKP